MKGTWVCRDERCRLRPGEDSGSWYDLFQETRGAFAGRSAPESDRNRLRLADSMGCITLELKVTACLLRADRGSSLE
jgi:hypothetical protein